MEVRVRGFKPPMFTANLKTLLGAIKISTSENLWNNCYY